MILLAVPHRLQFGVGADQFVNDCAGTSAGSVLEALRGWRIPVDALARRTKLMYQPKAGLTVRDVKALLELFGVQGRIFSYSRGLGLDMLRGFLNQGKPVIGAIKVNYSPLAHAVVVVGYDEGTFYYNDPMLTKTQRVSAPVFSEMLFWQGTAWGYVADGKIDWVSSILVHRNRATEANVRAKPTIQASIVRRLKDGDRISFRPSEIKASGGYHWLKIGADQWVALEVI